MNMAEVIKNEKVLRFIDESAALCSPDRIVLIDGSKEQRDALRAEACSTGEIIKLNEDLLPECYLHRTAVNDVARVEDRTFICCRSKDDAGPINNWMDPKEAYKMAGDIFKGCNLYTSDAADERASVDLGGRRIIKKKRTDENTDEHTLEKYKY